MTAEFEPKEKIILNDPEVVPVLFHPQKQLILSRLIVKELNIKDIVDDTKLNPGTVKRHITDLLSKNLIKQIRTEVNNYGITMKYYRAIAKNFSITLEWP